MEAERGTNRKAPFREILRRIPLYVSEVLEGFFYRLGLQISRSPGRWLAGCTVVVLICLSGLPLFRQERNPLKLWVPPDSDFITDTEWLMSNFGEGMRVQTVIMTAENVLEPQNLLKLNEITKRVLEARAPTESNTSWTDVCFKVPVIATYLLRKKRNAGKFEDSFNQESETEVDATDPTAGVPTSLYCAIFNNLSKACLLYSILDIWRFDSNRISYGTKENIIEDFNSASRSPTLGHPVNFTKLLGGITRDENGMVVAAKSVKTQWMVYVNFSAVDMDESGNDVGTADWGTKEALDWESAFLRELEDIWQEQNDTQGFGLWYEAARSYGDISMSTMFHDIGRITAGIVLMSIYVQLILSNRNWVEWRFYLTTAGLLCVGGAFIIAVGLCSMIGVPYGPVHNSLPFMLMGLGVDDIFVMMASWDEVLSDELHRAKPLEERVALMLGHAGAAISITSLTDVVAFVIGASTILPSLQSFCIYAAVGVFVTFLLQVTFFVAFFTLDMRRAEAKRNGVIPCIVHSSFEPAPRDKIRTSWRMIQAVYSRVVLTHLGKITVLTITVGFAAFGVLGSCQLEQFFDPNWLVPKGTYLADYLEVRDKNYPYEGYEAAVYMGDFNYSANFPDVLALAKKLRRVKALQSVEPWPIEFEQYLRYNFQKNISSDIMQENDFDEYLSKFLFSPIGGKYQKNFRFEGNLTCGKKAPKVSVSSLDFTFRSFSGPHEWIPAMDTVKRLAAESSIDGFVTVWSRMFASWVTDKVIAEEVTRNLILALVCVMATTAVVIAELQTCFWILLCVLLTLLDVCGFMFYWGLSIDIVSCIGLELAVGLSVDYAAHVAHAFLLSESSDGKPNRTARALNAVTHIGAAVTCGAGSTLLALSLLAGSEAYVFRSFFKIFLLVVVFGLWHGLMLLPVVLSTVGPSGLRVRKTVTTKSLELREKKLEASVNEGAEVPDDLGQDVPANEELEIPLNKKEYT